MMYTHEFPSMEIYISLLGYAVLSGCAKQVPLTDTTNKNRACTYMHGCTYVQIYK